jgi:phosphoribosyl 1,2-cyclic phosphodiesterase
MPGVVLYCSAATMEAISLPDHVDFCPANASYGITKCETGSSVLMSSFPVPHDAEDARGFVIKIVGSTKVGYLVDAGYVSEAMAEALEGCETVFMESNHDEKMLEECERHPSVKIRVAGCRGHLSNRVVSDLIERLACSGLKRAVLCHLSHEANTPELAKATIQRANTNVEILVARPGLSVDF